MDKIKSITVSINEQRLEATSQMGETVFSCAVATAKNGIGQQFGSECTPLGDHIIRAKIGRDAPENAVFVGRRFTGEIYNEQLAEKYPDRDWILTRILWLSGCEPGFNRLGQVDTMRRFIYIHGAPESHSMGVPSSHGCIKMTNRDIMRLYDWVSTGTNVLIKD